MSLLSLGFEGAVALILVLVAGLCWRLDRRLTALKSGQDGVRQTVVELAEATAHAEASVKALRAAGDSAGRDLDEKVARARALADELGFLISSSEGESGGRRSGRRVERQVERGAQRTPEPSRERAHPTREAGRADAFADLLADGDAPADVDQLRRRLRGVR